MNLLEYDSVISFDDLISKLNINNPQIIIDTLTKLIEDEIILVKQKMIGCILVLNINRKILLQRHSLEQIHFYRDESRYGLEMILLNQ